MAVDADVRLDAPESLLARSSPVVQEAEFGVQYQLGEGEIPVSQLEALVVAHERGASRTPAG